MFISVSIFQASDMANKALFLEKVKLSNAACQSGDFEKAISLYTEAIKLDPANHILYSNRSAALIKLGQFSKALKARDELYGQQNHTYN